MDLIEEHDLLGSKLASTPVGYNHKLTIVNDDDLLDNSSHYRQLVGKWLYLTFTRLDIVCEVQVLAQFMYRPGTSHLQGTYWVLKYLKGSLGQGILLPYSSNMQLKAFCDGNCVGSPTTRKSVTRYAIFLGQSLISWRFKKQSIVTKSSTEAEYRAMSPTCCEIISLLFLLKDFGISHHNIMLLHCDNLSALSIRSVTPLS